MSRRVVVDLTDANEALSRLLLHGRHAEWKRDATIVRAARRELIGAAAKCDELLDVVLRIDR